jgi:Helix-turn-helix domain of resolvase
VTNIIELSSVRQSRRPREDALPEHLDYRDDGCEVFPSCLACPLPRCRYDVPGGARAILNVVRDAEIRRMRFEGDLEVEEIAKRFRVSRRTVFRVLNPKSTTRELTRDAG